jgi:fucose 4-O-acetylase-like acetyltransferase
MLVHDDPRILNIETLRLVAVFSLVAYHTIGATSESGLELAYPHPLRFAADALVDLRMPLFAFISGWIYAQRPVAPHSFGRFFSSKLRRLYIPGVVAALSFWIISTFIVPDSAGQNAPIANIFTLTYVHYWFLHAILFTLLGIALVESLLRAPLGPVALGIAALTFFLLPGIYVPHLHLNGVLYLAPFFFLGVLLARQEDFIHQNRTAIIIISITAAACGLALNMESLLATGEMSLDRRDVQSALLSIGLIILLLLFLPRIRALSGFGSVAFTIYLYHVFGTSGMRRAADAVGIEATPVVFILCVAAGFGVPILIHVFFLQTVATRTFFLGIRQGR